MKRNREKTHNERKQLVELTDLQLQGKWIPVKFVRSGDLVVTGKDSLAIHDGGTAKYDHTSRGYRPYDTSAKKEVRKIASNSTEAA